MFSLYGRQVSRFVLFVAIAALVSASSAGTAAAQSKKAPKHFAILYVWGGDSIDDVDPLWAQEADLTLYSNGRLDVLDFGIVYPNCGDWFTQKNGRYITFDLDVGVVYSGVRQSNGSYYGAMTAPNGMTGVWVGYYLP